MYCDKMGVRFVHGVEIYLTEKLEHIDENGETYKIRDNYHTVLMARNEQGVKELNRLVSKSCDKEHFYYTNRISFDEFLGISDNILSTSACLASPLNKLPDTHPRYMELASKYDYLEIQPHLCEEQIDYNKRLYKLSKKIGKPLIAGTDTHSSSKYKGECRSVLIKAKHKSYGDEDLFDLTYHTYDELLDLFKQQNALPDEVCREAVEITNQIYERTEDFNLDTAIKYPILYGTREKDSEKFIETIEEKFEDKLRSGVIPQEQYDAFRAAIDEEIRVFRKLNMDGFMLSMSELICWCKSQNMAIGTARGSVGGSRVAYVLDIIDLNPETWNTVFSRFCNEDREEIGDIDIDVVESDRPAIFEYIVNRFGVDKTARVGSYGTIQAKGVMDDVGRYLRDKWSEENPDNCNNPYSIKNIERIKKEFAADEEGTKRKYSELFYYFDGLFGTKVSQSVHPAGMVISPISLSENYGVFDKDGELCLMMDMDEAHEVGVAKYDFLVLKTVQVIRDTCRYLNIDYPKTHEIDWCDEAVWNDILRSPTAIFQFESPFAFDCLKKYKPKNIFDMSLVTACIRPSGASYRNELLAKKLNHNPSVIIDELLKDNNGYLVYQEDVIKFLQLICGLSGSEADNIRRAIGRKDEDRLQQALPSILEGYCSKSDKIRDEAEKEAMEFIKIIDDASSYMFGYNHSIAYCLLGYLCAYFRYYHPIEFITAFLNNAANDEDISNGTALAKKYGITVTLPKFGYSGADYTFNKDENIIAKGVSSIKYMGKKATAELYHLGASRKFEYFVDVLSNINTHTSVDARQIDTLIKIDFFSEYGNQRELIRICDIFEMFKKGEAKQMSKAKLTDHTLIEIVKKYSTDKNKDGSESANYKLLDVMAIMRESEKRIKDAGMSDLGDILKVRNFFDIMGYAGYVSGVESDRPKLFIKEVFPVRRKKDGKQFGYSIITQSIGSGIESRFTVFNKVFNQDPINKDDIIRVRGYEKDGIYFTLTRYEHIYT